MKTEQTESNHPISNRKISDRALILLLVGCLLLMPPLANIFQLDVRVMGIPFTGIYLFVVWGVLIVGAAFLSNRLQRHADWEDNQGEATDNPLDTDD